MAQKAGLAPKGQGVVLARGGEGPKFPAGFFKVVKSGVYLLNFGKNGFFGIIKANFTPREGSLQHIVFGRPWF